MIEKKNKVIDKKNEEIERLKNENKKEREAFAQAILNNQSSMPVNPFSREELTKTVQNSLKPILEPIEQNVA